MKNIAIFASGSGTNAENIINYFKESDVARVNLVLCNNPSAYVLERAKAAGISSMVFSKAELNQSLDSNIVFSILKKFKTDYIILAGFLLKMPTSFVDAYPRRIINIHPALLPNYGGKGMYGMNVHNAIIAAKEQISGITIHLVDNQYDHGETLFQATCAIDNNDTAEDLAHKIHLLEQANFPRVINDYICRNTEVTF